MTSSANLSNDIETFKEKTRKNAEELVLSKFPKKILELDELLADDKFKPNASMFAEDINIPIDGSYYPSIVVQHKDGPQSVKRKRQSLEQKCLEIGFDDRKQCSYHPMVFANGVVQCNQYLIEMTDLVKPYLIDLLQDANLLCLGISLMIPTIEDGNNFGVEIQQETLESIHVIEDDIQSNYDSISVYFKSRAELVEKVAKFPSVLDFRRAIRERDQKFCLNLFLILTNIRNHYATLHDLVTKNLSKIKHPKSASSKEMLY